MIVIGVILGLLAAPLLVFAAALFRALFLVWPATVAIGALHSYIPAVPSLGWQAVFFLIMAVGLVFPSSSSSSSSTTK